MRQGTVDENKKPMWRLKGKPVKIGKATLQRRADPVTVRDLVSGKLNSAANGRHAGGLILNGQHTFLEVMPCPSWFKIRMTTKGQRQVFLVLRCTGLEPIECGPFRDESRALWMLDRMFNGMLDYLSSPGEFDKGPWSEKERRKRKHSVHLSLME